MLSYWQEIARGILFIVAPCRTIKFGTVTHVVWNVQFAAPWISSRPTLSGGNGYPLTPCAGFRRKLNKLQLRSLQASPTKYVALVCTVSFKLAHNSSETSDKYVISKDIHMKNILYFQLKNLDIKWLKVKIKCISQIKCINIQQQIKPTEVKKGIK